MVLLQNMIVIALDLVGYPAANQVSRGDERAIFNPALLSSSSCLTGSVNLFRKIAVRLRRELESPDRFFDEVSR